MFAVLASLLSVPPRLHFSINTRPCALRTPRSGCVSPAVSLVYILLLLLLLLMVGARAALSFLMLRYERRTPRFRNRYTSRRRRDGASMNELLSIDLRTQLRRTEYTFLSPNSSPPPSSTTPPRGSDSSTITLDLPHHRNFIPQYGYAIPRKHIHYATPSYIYAYISNTFASSTSILNI